MLQPLLFLEAEGFRPGDCFADVLSGGLSVDFQDFGAQLDAGFIRRAVLKQEIDDDASVIQLSNGDTDAAGDRFAESPVSRGAEGGAYMAVGYGPGEVAQGELVGLGICICLGLFEARAEFRTHCIPVDALVLREGVLAAELVQHGVEGGGVIHLGEVVRLGGFTLDEVNNGLSRAVEGERVAVEADQGVAGRQTQCRVVLREEQAVFAIAGGKALFVVGGVNQ